MYTIMSFTNAVDAYKLSLLDEGWTEDNYWGLCDYGDMDTEETFDDEEEALDTWACQYSGSYFWYENDDIYVQMFLLLKDDDEIDQSSGSLTREDICWMVGIHEDC